MSEILIRTRRPDAAPPSRGRVVHADRHVEILAEDGPLGLAVHDDGTRLCVLTGHAVTERAAADVLAGRGDPAGHFVAACYDRTTGVVTVHRDPGGFRAGFHADGAGFATDLGWLATDGGPRRGVDPGALALYVSLQYVPAPYTIYRGIRQLRPGDRLTLADGATTVHTGQTRFPDAEDISFEDAAEHVLDLLEASARAQLRPDATPGAFLSGGMDTSTNIAMLVNRLGIKPLALTASFREGDFDEAPYAREVAEHFGLTHVEVEIVPAQLADLPDVVAAFDTPHGDRAVFAEHFLAARARELGCTQVVTGEGGDEIMGYPRARDGEEDFAELPAEPGDLAAWYLAKTCLAPEPWRTSLLDALGTPHDAPMRFLAGTHREFARRTPFERLHFGQWRTWLLDGVRTKDHRVLTAAGLEPVFPFMSDPLMRRIAALPPELKRIGLRDKAFLKHGLRAQLPAATLTKTKQKFWLPFAEWFRGPARPYLEDVLLARDGFVAGTFGHPLLRGLADEHLAGTDHSRLLWALLFLELWHGRHVRR